MARVLLVEDDRSIEEPLVQALARQGYRVDVARTGSEALTVASEADLVVLDLGLPDLDGVDVCRQLREGRPGVPILILSARTDEGDLVVGLDAGADDYVTKPFRIHELSARIRALLRRAAPEEEPVLVVGDVELDHERRHVTVGGVAVYLTPKEYDLLQLLLQRAGRVVERGTIMRDVWRTEWVGNTKTLDMHVSSLRRKLGAAGSRILTVRGVGLRYEPTPRSVAAEPGR